MRVQIGNTKLHFVNYKLNKIMNIAQEDFKNSIKKLLFSSHLLQRRRQNQVLRNFETFQKKNNFSLQLLYAFVFLFMYVNNISNFFWFVLKLNLFGRLFIAPLGPAKFLIKYRACIPKPQKKYSISQNKTIHPFFKLIHSGKCLFPSILFFKSSWH